MKAFLGLAAATLLAASASSAFGAVLTSDDFNYTGALTANGWAAHSGAGNKQILANGSVATLEQSAGSGEDVNLSFTALTATDKMYAAFDLNLPSATNPVGGITSLDLDVNGLYLAHVKDSGFGFRSRTGVVVKSGAGDYGLAINANSSALGAGVTWASDLSYDVTYRVVISYDAATGASELWLDPASEASTKIVDTTGSIGTLISAFALRQSNDYTGGQTIDNVFAGNTFNDVLVPEPSSLMLLGLGALALVRRRR